MARRRGGSPIQTLIGLIGTSIFWLSFFWNRLGASTKIIVVASLICALLGIGAIIYYFAQQRHRRLKALKMSDVDNMNGLDFEHYIAALFRHRGYTAKVTKASGDLGIDIILEKAGIKYGVQVKRYSKPVSRRAVSDAVGAISHYNCQSAIVVTNNYFTRDAIELARSNNCQLVDRDLLADWISDFQALD